MSYVVVVKHRQQVAKSSLYANGKRRIEVKHQNTEEVLCLCWSANNIILCYNPNTSRSININQCPQQVGVQPIRREEAPKLLL